MKVAAIQFHCEDDHDANLRRAERLLASAAADGAELLVLPELFAASHHAGVMRDRAEPFDGPTLSWATRIASDLQCALIPGSFVERDGDRVFNTSCLLDDTGAVVASYRKIHLFDVEVDGTTILESAAFAAGDTAIVGTVADTTIGLTICYDLRFPELFRAETLLGATMIAVPSAFTATTGRDHWEVLLRARAIEDQVTIIAAAQWGTSPDGTARHGHTMIIDAWGRVLAEAGGEGDTVVVADIDDDVTRDVRRRLPVLEHRRPAAYGRD